MHATNEGEKYQHIEWPMAAYSVQFMPIMHVILINCDFLAKAKSRKSVKSMREYCKLLRGLQHFQYLK